MAAKDAHLTRGPISSNVLYLSAAPTFLAAFEVELEVTPKIVDQAPNDRTQEAFLVEVTAAAMEPTLLESGGPSLGDGVAPVVSNFTAPGDLGDANSPITFDVTDVDPGIGLILVSILFAGDTEPTLVHSGSQFEGLYASLSTKVAITDGFAFSLRRTGGWPGNITNVWVYGVDSGGTVGALP
jgi:hypothetical protein